MYDEDYLAHYGVLGMKWGQRKEEETFGKRPKSSKNNIFKRFGKVTTRTVNKAKQAYIKTEKKKIAKRDKKIADKFNRDRMKATKATQKQLLSSDSRKQRELALSTHDPSVLVKYQHLLTDDELRSRYNRLSMENNVRILSSSKKKTQFNDFKTKADWVMNTPVVKAGLNIGTKYLESQININEATKATEQAIKAATVKTTKNETNKNRSNPTSKNK